MGLNGTLVNVPHSWQETSVQVSGFLPVRFARSEIRQFGQRVGWLLRSFFAKNSCSPAVKTKFWEQSRQFKVLSSMVISGIKRSPGRKDRGLSKYLVSWIPADNMPRNQEEIPVRSGFLLALVRPRTYGR